MKLASIDIETTGLDEHTCSILEFGCVVFDPQPELAVGGFVNQEGRRWQTFQRIIKHSRVQGEPYAIGLNADIINEIAGRKETHIPIVTITNFVRDFSDFLHECGARSQGEKFTVVGKNYCAFDEKFLERVPGWNTRVKPLLERRVLDVGSLCFRPGDGKVVNLEKCLEMIGVRDTVSHRALDDALQVATVVSRFFA